ncbi:hypothetical protein [Marinobacter shengliensis]|uniref:hypothetical protein n=1 Tax=Marinobacter shengliensis TaxID=1389223 RepID=UPI0011089CB4|nr:hypothetical protein [Marinobacter shengliensis]
MRAQSWIVLAAFTGLTMAGGMYIAQQTGKSDAQKRASALEARQTPALHAPDETTQQAPNQVLELAVKYLEIYGDSIHQPATQARLYNERRRLIEDDARHGARLFRSAVETAFPDNAKQILTLMANLDRYHEWLDDNELRLQALMPLQRETELWQLREALFGALASQIWGEEASFLEEKSQRFQQAVSTLEESGELQLTELAHQLHVSAEEIYGSDMTRQFAGSGALGHALFSLDSVQSHLHQLPPDQRQQTMTELRRQFGYPEAALERMAKQDQLREEKWRNGDAYMAKRQTLTQRLTGEELESELNRLREEHFGIAAPTIAREEEEGFYRFERPRRYGLN